MIKERTTDGERVVEMCQKRKEFINSYHYFIPDSLTKTHGRILQGLAIAAIMYGKFNLFPSWFTGEGQYADLNGFFKCALSVEVVVFLVAFIGSHVKNAQFNTNHQKTIYSTSVGELSKEIYEKTLSRKNCFRPRQIIFKWKYFVNEMKSSKKEIKKLKTVRDLGDKGNESLMYDWNLYFSYWFMAYYAPLILAIAGWSFLEDNVLFFIIGFFSIFFLHFLILPEIEIGIINKSQRVRDDLDKEIRKDLWKK